MRRKNEKRSEKGVGGRRKGKREKVKEVIIIRSGRDREETMRGIKRRGKNSGDVKVERGVKRLRKKKRSKRGVE